MDVLKQWLSEKTKFTGPKLQAAVKQCEEGMIFSVADLLEVYEEMPDMFEKAFPQVFLQGKIRAALDREKDRIRASTETEEPAKKDAAKITKEDPSLGRENAVKPVAPLMPPHCIYHYFASHKKTHSIHGPLSEIQAILTKDHLAVRGFVGFFDIDNLTSITMAELTINIQQSCCLVLILDDETYKSTWCIHEIDTAKKFSIPVITVVNGDKFVERTIIQQYQSLGYDHIFNEQVIGYSNQYRQASFDKLMGAIARAVEKCRAMFVPAIKLKSRTCSVTRTQSVTEVPLSEQFSQTVISKYGSAADAWSAFDAVGDTPGKLTRADFKKIILQLGMKITSSDKGKLRKLMDPNNTKLIVRADFLAFFSGKGESPSLDTQAPPSLLKLATLPIDVPAVPDQYRSRVETESHITALLLGRAVSSSSCIIAVGMGGAGKSSLKAAVVRQDKVREHFVDGIAWLSLGQKPDILALQKRLCFQLTKKHISQRGEGEASEQHASIVTAVAGKTVLCCVDDCWDNEAHLRFFDVVDSSTPSKLLVSTRISGLVPRSTEVKISLMTVAESVQLLAHAAGLDSTELGGELVEVAGLCGRAAQMIVDSGDNWLDDALPDMRADGIGAGDGVGVQDAIIIASMKSISGDNAQRIKSLLLNSAIFCEDQRIPKSIFHCLYVASTTLQDHEGRKSKQQKQATRTVVMKWVSVLIKRNLLMELVRGSLQLHDIVRDYCISSYKDSKRKLKLLQRAFCAELLARKDKDTWQDVSGENIPKGLELDWFCCSALTAHIEAAWAKPLTSDKQASSWVNHPSTTIAVLATKALPALELLSLTKKLIADEEYLQAATLLGNVLTVCVFNDKEMLEQIMLFWKILDHIDADDRGDRLMLFDVHLAAKAFVSATTGTAEWQSAMGRLVQLDQSGIELPPVVLMRIYMIRGAVKIGVTSMMPHPTADQYYQGQQLMRKSSTYFRKAIQSDDYEVGGPKRRYHRILSYTAFNCMVCDYWTERDEVEQESLSPRLLIAASAEYQFEVDYEWARHSSFGVDLYLYMGPYAVMLGTRLTAGIIAVSDALDFWEQTVVQAVAAGDLRSYYSFLYVFPLMRLLPDRARQLRVLQATAMCWSSFLALKQLNDWSETSVFQPSARSWKSAGDTAFYEQPKTFAFHTMAELFQADPGSIQTAEILQHLSPPSACIWIKDGMCGINGLFEPLGVLLGAVADELGQSELAVIHARVAVGSFHNLVKTTYARMLLARILPEADVVQQVLREPTKAHVATPKPRALAADGGTESELRHRQYLEACNNGNLAQLKVMLSDNVVFLSPLGKQYEGRAKVEVALQKIVAMIKGKFETEGGIVSCRTQTISVADRKTRAIYKVEAMGMNMVVGDEATWAEDGNLTRMETAMNPDWDI